MDNCLSCGLEKKQLCFHEREDFQRDMENIRISPFILEQLIQIIDIENRYYQQVLSTLSNDFPGLVRTPQLSCLKAAHSAWLARQAQKG